LVELLDATHEYNVIARLVLREHAALEARDAGADERRSRIGAEWLMAPLVGACGRRLRQPRREGSEDGEDTFDVRPAARFTFSLISAIHCRHEARFPYLQHKSPLAFQPPPQRTSFA